MNESIFKGAALKRQIDQEKKESENGLRKKQSKDVHVNVSMSEETRRKLWDLAERNDTNVSHLIRSWIIQKYDEQI